MTNHASLHTPTPEFRVGLESEILRAYRREQSIRTLPRSGNAWVRRLTSLAAALVIGVVVGAAPAQVQDARQRDSLLTAAQAEERIMMLRVQLVRAEAARAAKAQEAGVVSRASVAKGEGELQAAEVKLRTVQLNIEEIKATSSAPRDDITAPLISGRDFVKERLELQALAAQHDLTAAEGAAEEANRRHAIGIESTLAVQQAETDRDLARVAISLLAAKLDLRRRFLGSHPPAAEIERSLRTLELRHALMQAQIQVKFAQERLEQIRDGVNRGVFERAALLRAELDLLERQAEISRIESQLNAMR